MGPKWGERTDASDENSAAHRAYREARLWDGDPSQETPPPGRAVGSSEGWGHSQEDRQHREHRRYRERPEGEKRP